VATYLKTFPINARAINNLLAALNSRYTLGDYSPGCRQDIRNVI